MTVVYIAIGWLVLAIIIAALLGTATRRGERQARIDRSVGMFLDPDTVERYRQQAAERRQADR